MDLDLPVSLSLRLLLLKRNGLTLEGLCPHVHLAQFGWGNYLDPQGLRKDSLLTKSHLCAVG